MKVLVVDDHAMFRDGLTAILNSLEDVEVVGTAADGAEAVELSGQLRPHVVLMDLHMPNMNGIDATRTITSTHPDIVVLILTMLDDDASVFSALEAGAQGYLLKESGRDVLAQALQASRHGHAILDTSVAGRVLRGRSDRRGLPDPNAFPFLTDREREVLDLVARGLTNPAIAARLYVSEKTVRNHASNIFSKLHVNDRAAAVARARDAGYGQRSP